MGASSNLKVLLGKLERPRQLPWEWEWWWVLFVPDFTASVNSPGNNVCQESKEKTLWLFLYLWETPRSGLRSQRGRSELLGKFWF